MILVKSELSLALLQILTVADEVLGEKGDLPVKAHAERIKNLCGAER